VFDLLINSEVIVADVAVAERVFVEALGFPPQRDSWGSKIPGFGFTYLFARVHPSLKVSPTRVQALAKAPLDPAIDPRLTLPFLPALFAAQGRRPWKTHATELATSDIQAVAARLARNGCRFHTMPSTDVIPYTRLWLGWTSDEPGAYQPDVDGGLLIEICETDSLQQGPALWEPGPDPELPPGSMVRVLRRSWIVEDLGFTLSALDRNLGWQPRVGPEIDAAIGCRRAVFGFAHPRSAELELLEPIAAGEVKDSFDAWGPGSWTIRIGVNDIEAKAEDLRRRGTAFETRTRPDGGKPLLRVDTGPLDVPGLFEFAEV
jgi:hypothetical protein